MTHEATVGTRMPVPRLIDAHPKSWAIYVGIISHSVPGIVVERSERIPRVRTTNSARVSGNMLVGFGVMIDGRTRTCEGDEKHGSHSHIGGACVSTKVVLAMPCKISFRTGLVSPLELDAYILAEVDMMGLEERGIETRHGD